MASTILAQFDERQGLYDAFRISAETALKELIRLEGVHIHSVTSRLKARDSLAEKVTRGGKDSYNDLVDVTDVVGLRVITHIEDEVDRIGALIQREFLIDTENSIDKRQVLDPDRFGYLSLHFVCSFTDERTSVAENRRFSGLKFEVQVRSILQHAWAEIEHDLGYKSGSTIPVMIRRRFSRLAGLLEIADSEFRSLRDELQEYATELPGKIRDQPQAVALDETSLDSFIQSSAEVALLDSQMSSVGNLSLIDGKWDDLASTLAKVDVTTIDSLQQAIRQYGSVVLAQWKRRIADGDALTSTVRKGISIFHLWQVLAVAQGGAAKLEEVFEAIGARPRKKRRTDLTTIIEEELTKAKR